MINAFKIPIHNWPHFEISILTFSKATNNNITYFATIDEFHGGLSEEKIDEIAFGY